MVSEVREKCVKMVFKIEKTNALHKCDIIKTLWYNSIRLTIRSTKNIFDTPTAWRN